LASAGVGMAVNLYFVGTAGCGKSTLTYAFEVWMEGQGFDAVTVNLDPGAEALLYTPDIDVRDWVKLPEIMAEYGLGPNGAQIVAADMLALNAREVAQVMGGFDTDYFLIDTPGQLELFAFRYSAAQVIDTFGRDQTALCFLYDPVLVKTPGGFVTAQMLAATTHFRHPVPLIGVLAKADLLTAGESERIVQWAEDADRLLAALLDSPIDAQTQLSFEFLKALDTIGAPRTLQPVSAERQSGFEDIYNLVQQTFKGGEDLEA